MKTKKMKLEDTEDVLTRNNMANIMGGILVERDPNAVRDARMNGGGGTENRGGTYPIVAGSPYINEKNDVVTLTEVISDGFSWIADHVKVGIGACGSPKVTFE